MLNWYVASYRNYGYGQLFDQKISKKTLRLMQQ